MTAQAGVYALFNKSKLVYIGKSDCLLGRIGEHQKEGVKEFDSFELFPIDGMTERGLLRIESELIKILNPKYNVMHNRSGDKVPITGKTNMVAFINMLIKMIKANLKGDDDACPLTFCLCGECAYYNVNVRRNRRIVGRNRAIYQNSCSMDEFGAGGLSPMDGCSRGLPKKYAEVYREET